MLSRIAVVAAILAILTFLAFAAAESVELRKEKGALGSGRIFVDCTIDDQPRECFLDTGSSESSVFSDSFFSKYSVLRQTKSSGANGAETSEDVIRVKKFFVGRIALPIKEMNRVAESSLKYKAFCFGADGLAGSQWRLSIKSGGLRKIHTWPLISKSDELILIGGKVPAVEFGAGGEKLQAIIDTGAQLTTISERLINRFPDRFVLVKDDMARDSSGSTSTIKIYRCKNFSAGPFELKDDFVVAMDFRKMSGILNDRVQLILGYNTLSKYELTLNFPAKKFLAQAANKF